MTVVAASFAAAIGVGCWNAHAVVVGMVGKKEVIGATTGHSLLHLSTC